MLTLPNLLTLSRIVAVPLLAWFLWWPGWAEGYAAGFALYCLMGITDYFDGYLARANGTVSKLERGDTIVGTDETHKGGNAPCPACRQSCELFGGIDSGWVDDDHPPVTGGKMATSRADPNTASGGTNT